MRLKITEKYIEVELEEIAEKLANGRQDDIAELFRLMLLHLDKRADESDYDVSFFLEGVSECLEEKGCDRRLLSKMFKVNNG
jgi:hypothetical protein